MADPTLPTPVIGVAALCAKWFREVGLQTEGGDLGALARDDYERVVRCLRQVFPTVVAPGVISTLEEANAAVAAFRQNAVDALVLVHLMWSEDQPLLVVLEGCPDVPLLLWDYHPTGALPPHLRATDLFRLSGTVGMLQGSAPLQRLKRPLFLVAGTPGEARLLGDMQEYATALAIRKEFSGMAVGRIAGRCEVMTGTYVNSETLQRALGPRLVEIRAAEYAAACGSVAPERIETLAAELTARYPIKDVSPDSLRLACRNTLALDVLVLRYDLRAVAIQDLDPDLHRLAGIRPCLCPPESARRGVAFGMESDLNTTLGMLAAMRAGRTPCMYTEIFTYDPTANLLLMGHAGVHDPRLAGADGVTIVPDEEYRHVDRCEGAWLEFIMAAGPVVGVSLYDMGGGYRMTTFSGESQGAPRRLQGFAHAVVRPTRPVRELLASLVRRGLTQHFAVAPAGVEGVLAKWCSLSGITYCPEG